MNQQRALTALLSCCVLVLISVGCAGNSADSRAADPAPTMAPSQVSTVAPSPNLSPVPAPSPGQTDAAESPWRVLNDTLVFEDARFEIAESTQIPARLPSVWYHPVGESGDLQTTTAVSPFGYSVYLSVVDWCPGTTACTFATFEARAPDHEYGLSRGGDYTVGVPVPLPNGMTGWYHDATCGASCSHGWVFWREGVNDYGVGVKVGSAVEVLPLAWSAIDPTADYPFEIPMSCSEVATPSPDGQRAAELIADNGLTWLVLCGASETAEVTVVHSADQLRWRNVTSVRWAGGADSPEILASDGLTTWIFQETMPVFDQEPWARLAGGDLRCGDADGDGVEDLVDAASSEIVVFSRPVYAERQPIDPAVAEALTAC